MKEFVFEPMFAGMVSNGVKWVLLMICLLVGATIVGAIVFLVVKLSKTAGGKNQSPPPIMPTAQSTQRICKSCGTELSPTSSEGLCPACLMKVAMGSEGGNPAGSSSERKAAPPPSEIGKFFPQLEILELLGQGGMGMVYKARQPQLDRLIALKILSPELSRDPAFAERFNREAKALARLNHPNIVGVYDFGKSGDFYYFIMEYVDGMNLWDLERAKKRLEPEEALAIVPKICDALQYAHDEGIVHRDIKPGNILIDKKGRVKIADFGLAKLVGKQPQDFHLTQSKMTLGTPHYMAPEQLADPQKVDHRADIYSLGVVFYEMLTGELPLGRFALPSEKVQVDVRLDEIVLRTLQQEPSRRYQHVSEVKTHVENISGVLEKLPPHLRNAIGFEYKSKATLFGLPWLHITSGVEPATGKRRVARGIIAIGDSAKGIIAFGGFARGVIAFGGLAMGVVSFGGMSVGLFSIGGLALGLILSYGGFAVAPIAMGGAAIGYYAFGGGAFGVHPLGGNVQDPLAQKFFLPWAQEKFGLINAAMLVLMFISIAVSIVIPAMMRQKMLSPNAKGKSALHKIWISIIGLAIVMLIIALPNLIRSPNQARQVTRGTLQTELSNKFAEMLAERRITYSQIYFHYSANTPVATVSFSGLRDWRGVTNGIPRPVYGGLTLLFDVPGVCDVSGDGDLRNMKDSFPIATRGYEWWMKGSPADGSLPKNQRRTSLPVTFGPVIERVIFAPGTAGNTSADTADCIDLDSGTLFVLPADLAGDEAAQRSSARQSWMLKQGIDAVGLGLPLKGLEGVDLYMGLCADQSWDQMSADSVESSLPNIVQQIPPVMQTWGHPKTTWLFRTRAGATGILQIVGFTEDPRGVKIRYKLVNQSSASRPVSQNDERGQPVPLPPGYEEGKPVPLPPGYQRGQVSLVPPASRQNLSFGPVIERVVNDGADGSGRDMYLDLDTSRLMSYPKDQHFRDPHLGQRWLATNGLDLQAINQARAWTNEIAEASDKIFFDLSGQHLPAGPLEGIFISDSAVLRLDYTRWDFLTPDALTTALAPFNAIGFYSAAGELPVTLGFKTREGGTGILQIIGLTENPRGVKIRYKLVKSNAAKSDPPQVESLEQQKKVKTLRLERDWMLAFSLYAAKHEGKCPKTFEDAAPYFQGSGTPENSIAPEQFEIMYQGSLTELTNKGNVIVIRQKESWQAADGRWQKAYGFADGHAEIHAQRDSNFGPWEAQHNANNESLPNQKSVVNSSQDKPAVSAELTRQITARYDAAKAMTSFSPQRDSALANVARDAARAGDADLARKALKEITLFAAQDSAAEQAARELAKTGHRAEAIDIAKTITSLSQRDVVLRELAK